MFQIMWLSCGLFYISGDKSSVSLRGTVSNFPHLFSSSHQVYADLFDKGSIKASSTECLSVNEDYDEQIKEKEDVRRKNINSKYL